ncbi:MAG: antibiotic biosynthesis monooxygenase [bacterium]|nr:antibiotic biosynthesis monooxygenase [bacterium]
MFIVHVDIHVKPDCLEPFLEVTLANARESVKEPGIARFDVMEDLQDPEHFVLVEVYRTEDDPAKHKQTAHYKTWRETVGGMMAEARSSVKLTNCFPDDAAWG